MQFLGNGECLCGECKTALGLYCHVPFCANRCSYCAFYQERPTREMIERYLRCITIEISLLLNIISEPFDTVYIGGGTPGILTAENFGRLCAELLKGNGKIAPVEFSVEFSPNTVRGDRVEMLKSFGCNRITMGVQSFNRQTLKALGRRQATEQVFKAYETIAAHGIGSIGIDLIFAVPGQTIDDWLADLQCAVDLNPKHISTYDLSFEGGTQMASDLAGNRIRKKSESEEVAFYLKTWDFLEKNGYEHYEISNFCRPGFESKHNTNTWRMQRWIGIGPSACSQFDGKRFANPQSLPMWAEKLERAEFAHCDIEVVDARRIAEDRLIFGIRMDCGVTMDELKQIFPNAADLRIIETLFGELAAANLAQISEHCVKLTKRGSLLADSIAVEISARLS